MSHTVMPANAYHSASDEAGRCPHCYKTGDQKMLGIVTIDGVNKPAYHCTGCNKAYADLPACIKVIADSVGSGTSVGFIPAPQVNNINPPQPVYTQNEGPERTNQKLDQVNSTLSNINSNGHVLSADINTLIRHIKSMVEQNSKLMEQLASDPMINVRKAVVEFNLK